MKFYVTDTDGETNGCFFTLKEAKAHIKFVGHGTVTVMDVSVNAESIKRLLSNNGGYANSVESDVFVLRAD